jgi:hypothetical protein
MRAPPSSESLLVATSINECPVVVRTTLCARRAFTFTARGGSAPEQVITAQLTKPDTNPSNDMRSAAVTVEFPTCASLLATGTRGCSRGQAALQTSGASPVSDDSQAVFDAVCCVSGWRGNESKGLQRASWLGNCMPLAIP